MKPKTDSAVQVIKSAFAKSGFSEQELFEAAFHLTDWVPDLKLFVEFLENPNDYSPKEVRRIVIALVVHAPDHLQNAAELILEGPAKKRREVATRRKIKKSKASESEPGK